MEEKNKSEGKCLFCGKIFAKAGINRHLSTHLNAMDKAEKAGLSFLLKVETPKRWGVTPYFLSLWVDGEATLKNIDKFLRDIWLDCCGHLSAFNYPRSRNFESMTFNFLEEDEDGILMNYKTKKVFQKGMTLNYEYDFGSTTELSITVVEEFPVKADKKIVLLSRNEPVAITCTQCGKAPATQTCSACMMYDELSGLCEKCAKKHAKECSDFDDYAAMPIVNSPRSGVCGYTGGIIDIERDGAYRI